MGNAASIVSSERMFVLSERFENDFGKHEAEAELKKWGIFDVKNTLSNLCIAGYLENIENKKGRTPGVYRITDAGMRIAVEFERIIARNAERCGYVLP